MSHPFPGDRYLYSLGLDVILKQLHESTVSVHTYSLEIFDTDQEAI